MNNLLSRLYAFLLSHFGSRADIRIDCSQGEQVVVYVNNAAAPYLETSADKLEAWLERECA